MHGTCLREVRLLGLHEELAAPGSEWHFCTGSLPGLDIVVNLDYSALFPRHFRQSFHSNIKTHETPYSQLWHFINVRPAASIATINQYIP